MSTCQWSRGKPRRTIPITQKRWLKKKIRPFLQTTYVGSTGQSPINITRQYRPRTLIPISTVRGGCRYLPCVYAGVGWGLLFLPVPVHHGVETPPSPWTEPVTQMTDNTTFFATTTTYQKMAACADAVYCGTTCWTSGILLIPVFLKPHRSQNSERHSPVNGYQKTFKITWLSTCF